MKILEIFNQKREEKIKLISLEQYQDLEKNFFTDIRFFVESPSSVFRTIKTSNRAEKLWSERSPIRV